MLNFQSHLNKNNLKPKLNIHSQIDSASKIVSSLNNQPNYPLNYLKLWTIKNVNLNYSRSFGRKENSVSLNHSIKKSKDFFSAKNSPLDKYNPDNAEIQKMEDEMRLPQIKRINIKSNSKRNRLNDDENSKTLMNILTTRHKKILSMFDKYSMFNSSKISSKNMMKMNNYEKKANKIILQITRLKEIKRSKNLRKNSN